MTVHETEILKHLNKVRGNNNVERIISEMLGISEYDVKVALESLLQKEYVYQESSKNQIALKQNAYKISRNGELKINELQKQSDDNKEKIIKDSIISNQKSTKNIGRLSAINTIVLLIFAGIECYYLYHQNNLFEKQNELLKEQNKIQSQQYKQQLKSDRPFYLNNELDTVH